MIWERYITDSLIETDNWAIEVKSGASGKTNYLHRFLNTYPSVKPMIVGGQGIPLDDFFSKPVQNWLV